MKTSVVLFAFASSLAACGGPPELLIETPFVDRAELEIPASGQLERTIDVTGNTVVMQGTAEVILRHPAPDDLTVTVTSPAGTVIELGGRIAEGGADYRYAVPLLDVQGESAAGPWRLLITDPGDRGPGVLVVWAIDVGGGAPGP